MQLSNLPTIVVWTMSLFSSNIRAEASMSGQWIAGCFQAALFYLPFVAGMVGKLFA